MILSFGGSLAEDLFFDRYTTATRRFSADLRHVAQRKLQYVNAASRLSDLRVPPGNRLEALRGDLRDYHSIRINDQWRVLFRWSDGAHDVQVVGHH